MLYPSTPASPGAIVASTATIQSRFGEVVVDTNKTLAFPRGLLGLPDKQNFALVNFPNEKMQQFTLLQSLDEHALSFITLPVGLENNIITASDIRTACQDMQIAEKNLALLLIVSVHRQVSEVKLSVNARAPILVDSARRSAAQYVFQNDRYKVQHML
jgi:flagellar assembly factor FliW